MKYIQKPAEYAFFTLLILLLLGWGFWEGIAPFQRSFDLIIFAVSISTFGAVYSNLTFSITTLFATLLLWNEVYRGDKLEPLDQGERVEAVIPVYQDHEVLANSINSLKNSDYSNLGINVICEPDDEKSIEEAENLDCNVLINQHPGSKAGAINTAFEELDAEYFALFDADEKVDSQFIGIAMAYMNQGYEVFQGRRVPIPSGGIEKFSYCERAVFHMAYKIQELTGFVHAKSSSTVLTKTAWEKVNGYDDMLTEDIDFGQKCFRYGLKVKSNRSVTNKMEAPHSFRDFWGQRKRWSIGTVEILHKGLRRGYGQSSIPREVFATCRSLVSTIIPIMLIVFFANFLVLVISGIELFFTIPILVTALPALILSYRDFRDKEIGFIGLYSLTSFLVVFISGLILLKSVLEYIFSWSGEWYRVEKGD
ncbi:MAG: cellulose synthase/poly-beta-1,6-N-acetylglucosamine synthase-like glycosyltransferase [Candidatus Nanohaloarchaea archaeon]